VLTFSAVSPAQTGYLRAWPAGSAPPNATVLNAVAGGSITNTVMLPLSPAGELEARYVGGVTHLVVDVLGYFVDPPTSQRVSVRTGGSQAAGFSSHPSVSSSGAQGSEASQHASISADGRYVAFESGATNLVPGDTNANQDVFVRELAANTTTRVPVGPSNVQANNSSDDPAISSTGHWVMFSSTATNLLSGSDTNGARDVFARGLL
jgi:hypothetical protein